MRHFSIPTDYHSSIISEIKQKRVAEDPYNKDHGPSVLEYPKLRIKLARNFGFCFGVQNAIEKAYRTVSEANGRRVFLLSEMIHNRRVNDDLKSKGVQFLSEIPEGYDILKPSDIVIIPAFGASLEVLEKLKARGIDPTICDTTCPFVERVWKKARALGEAGFTVVIHGKAQHEETKATFSHAAKYAPSIIIRDLKEAELVAGIIKKELSVQTFREQFGGLLSDGFDIERDLCRLGVVNQTTMLAADTVAISAVLRDALLDRYGEGHYADTKDTICYATTENQEAVKALQASGGDLAIVVGGYNSSNSSHLAELMSEKMPTYYIDSALEIISSTKIHHFSLIEKKPIFTEGWLPIKDQKLEVLITAGASCPDSVVDEVIRRLLEVC